MLAQHQGFLISALCFPPVRRLAVGKELGENTAGTAGLNWSKGYSMLCNIMPTTKLGEEEGDISKDVVAQWVAWQWPVHGTWWVIYFALPVGVFILFLHLLNYLDFKPQVFLLLFSIMERNTFLCWDLWSNEKYSQVQERTLPKNRRTKTKQSKVYGNMMCYIQRTI